LVNVSRDGQIAMRAAIESSLQRIDWDNKGLAVRLFPLVRGGDANEPRAVVVDPLRGFGRPTLVGTGIQTRVVAQRYRAGDSMADLAEDYNVTIDRIEDAVRCELRAAA
jgi:uncharacterized protein (DUF433 family)